MTRSVTRIPNQKEKGKLPSFLLPIPPLTPLSFPSTIPPHPYLPLSPLFTYTLAPHPLLYTFLFHPCFSSSFISFFVSFTFSLFLSSLFPSYRVGFELLPHPYPLPHTPFSLIPSLSSSPIYVTHPSPLSFLYSFYSSSFLSLFIIFNIFSLILFPLSPSPPSPPPSSHHLHPVNNSSSLPPLSLPLLLLLPPSLLSISS